MTDKTSDTKPENSDGQPHSAGQNTGQEDYLEQCNEYEKVLHDIAGLLHHTESDEVDSKSARQAYRKAMRVLRYYNVFD